LKNSSIRPTSITRNEAEVLRIARRETSPQHVEEFEPITRGFLFAVVALAPLGVMAAGCMAWKLLVRSATKLLGKGA